MIFKTCSEEQTRDIARSLASCITRVAIIALAGDLGMGKTLFTKAFAEALDIKGTVTSPTFNIVNEYNDGIIPLYHFDIYRLDHISELYNCGFMDYIERDGVCIIEWADRIRDEIPGYAIWVEFILGDTYTSREIIITGTISEDLC